MHRHERNPKIILHTHWIDKLAILNGFVSGGALLPQVWKVISKGDVQGLSAVSFGIIFMNSAVWGIYAFHRRLLSLFIASLLTGISSGLLLLFIL